MQNKEKLFMTKHFHGIQFLAKSFFFNFYALEINVGIFWLRRKVLLARNSFLHSFSSSKEPLNGQFNSHVHKEPIENEWNVNEIPKDLGKMTSIKENHT